MTMDDLIRRYPNMSKHRVWRLVRDGLLPKPAGKADGYARGRTSSDWTPEHVHAIDVMSAAQPHDRFNTAIAEHALIAAGRVRGDVLRRHAIAAAKQMGVVLNKRRADDDIVESHRRTAYEMPYELSVRKVFHRSRARMLLMMDDGDVMRAINNCDDKLLEQYHAGSSRFSGVIVGLFMLMSGQASESPIDGINHFISALKPVPGKKLRPVKRYVVDTTHLQYIARLVVLMLTLLRSSDKTRFDAEIMKIIGHIAPAIALMMKQYPNIAEECTRDVLNEYLPVMQGSVSTER